MGESRFRKTHLTFAPDSIHLLNRHKRTLTHRLRQITRRHIREGLSAQMSDAEKIDKELHNALQKAHEQKLALASQLALNLVNEQLKKTPSLIVAMASRLLKSISEHSDVEIKASPLDAHILAQSIGEINVANKTARKITVSEDSSIPQGSLIINANKSVVDAQIRTQCEKAIELLQMNW